MNLKKRDVPADFDEVCQRLSAREMIAHYRSSQKTIARWFSERGIERGLVDKRLDNGAASRAMPDDFAERDKFMTIRDLATHYTASRNTIAKWRSMLADASPARGTLRAIPSDFHAIAAAMSLRSLTAHYQAGKGTVARWYREAGVRPIKFKPPSLPIPDSFPDYARSSTNAELMERFGISLPTVTAWRKKCKVPSPRYVTAPAKRPAFNRPGPQAAPDSGRDDSPVGLAVEYMRSGSRGWNISRCDADGTFNPRGDHYRAGTMPVKTADEMMRWAADKGWKLVDLFAIAA